jgi:flagellar hook-associated protein FlgK
MGSKGTPADLHRLGFDTTLHIQGRSTDDLLVFVTDTAIPATVTASTVDVRAQFASIDGDMKQALRAHQLQVSFVSDTSYKITDTRTQTILAERSLIPDPLSATPSLTYRGLKLEFSTSPKKGDEFTIDGNRDGIGNNETMLRLVALEEQRIMPGGLTVTEAYIERVNQVGNVARQAAISEQALEVVYKQAQEARDTISGVSLDEEASALVRFQQAYQANAKVMQTAMALFDSILQIR